ncbi:MAG: hypothetical protein HKN32_09710 [Flavobacteriales bacterium]|nr:hypothetical protein [Flavobacteriales bacterium]
MLLALLIIAVIASQSTLVQNLFYAMNFERKLDRYDQSDQTESNLVNSVHPDGRSAELLSAFFGIDDGLPGLASLVICEGASGQDGMPIIFSSEIDVTTLEPGDLKVAQASGRIGEVKCLTMAPADDKGELRTALLVGQFGNIEDPPVRVEVTGNVHSIDGTTNFQGVGVDVTALEDGPSLIWGEVVPKEQWAVGVAATGIPFGGGSGCPEQTKQIVRVTWGGGVTKPNGAPANEEERDLYKVTVSDTSGQEKTITPIELADLGDGDNNHKLCLDTEAKVLSVSFPAERLTDPRDDLNLQTSVAISN